LVRFFKNIFSSVFADGGFNFKPKKKKTGYFSSADFLTSYYFCFICFYQKPICFYQFSLMGEKYYGDTPMNEIEEDILHAADDDGTYLCGEHHVYFLRLLSGKKKGEYPTTIQTAGKDAAIILENSV
jgi:hypothetical protein